MLQDTRNLFPGKDLKYYNIVSGTVSNVICTCYIKLVTIHHYVAGEFGDRKERSQPTKNIKNSESKIHQS